MRFWQRSVIKVDWMENDKADKCNQKKTRGNVSITVPRDLLWRHRFKCHQRASFLFPTVIHQQKVSLNHIFYVFLNSLFLDLFIHLFTYAYVCVCMGASLYGGLRLAMDVYLNGLPPYFLRQGSLTGLDQLAMGPRDPPSPSPQG